MTEGDNSRGTLGDFLLRQKRLPRAYTWRGVRVYALIAVGGLALVLAAAISGTAEWWAAVGALAFLLYGLAALTSTVRLLWARRSGDTST
jgi:hypothetical protein